jgi:hypothetical protein
MNHRRRRTSPITPAQIRYIESLVRKIREIDPTHRQRVTNDQMVSASANLRHLSKSEASERIDRLLERIAEIEGAAEADD